ncbi:unnamed protein product [Bursaphelenchus okinawaensis]|uniref:Peptidase A1 domain-containing protein n=1 Tax=Bursaphelenchus okinawaensis TaxID=465554 RepID=A0A811L9M9_9BILA|nr:unnamed protein product [Bursaphelenchus okinawaensis]CAG9119312.1 unnamed protein product [Bursaphelenchus okinawaensis]
MRLWLLLGVIIGLTYSQVINLAIRKWYYVVPVKIGTPNQTLYFALDVRTKDFWAYGGLCYEISSKCTKGTLQYFRGHSSSTYQGGVGTQTFNYTDFYYSGNGTVTASTANDKVVIDTIDMGTLNFGLSMSADYAFYKTLNASGVLGFGLGSNTSSSLDWTTVIGGNSYTLRTNDANETATITNGTDSTCASPYHYISLSSTNSSSKWVIPLTGFLFGNVTGGTLTGHTASFTTVNKNIEIPLAQYQPIHDEIVRLYYDFQWSHNLVDCRKRDQLPDLNLTFGGRNYTVTPYQYIRQTPTNYCILRLVPNYQSNEWVLGYPFHQRHCEEYDAGNDRIGLSTPS